MKKKILLITPPYHSGVVESAGRWLNVGFLYIAGSLKKAGYDVEVYDAMSLFHTHEQIKKKIENIKPDVVASTAITASYHDAIEVLKTAKGINPEIVTIIGNVHPTFCWTETLFKSKNYVDFIVCGEGEITFVELLNCINLKGEFDKVKGIAFLKQGEPFITHPREFIKELDLFAPAWELVSWKDYFYRPKKDSILAIVTSSRGCNQQCSFCSQQLFWKKIWRSRSAENFVNEIEMLNKKYGINAAMLSDETPTFDRNRWERILDLLIERKIKVDLLMETRVEDILRDEDILHKYKEAGIVHIYLGVESTNQETLDKFKKNIKVEESRRAIELINSHDIVTETSFVLGMPKDTKKSIAETVELALYYNPDMAFFLAITPWPYSDIYPELKDHIEVFDYRKYNLVEPIVKPISMSRYELEKELLESTKKFYFSKMQSLDKSSSYKQEFMISVMKLLIEHSYLAKHIKSSFQKLPASAKKLMKITPIS